MSDNERPVRSTEALRQWHRPLDDGMCRECGYEWPCAVGHLLGERDRLCEELGHYKRVVNGQIPDHAMGRHDTARVAGCPFCDSTTAAEKVKQLRAELELVRPVVAAAKACVGDLRNAGYRLSDNAVALVTAVDALAAAEQSTPDTCGSCNGERWVDDEGWSPENPEEWRQGRVVGSGRIPCGACNHGGWSVQDGRETSTEVGASTPGSNKTGPSVEASSGDSVEPSTHWRALPLAVAGCICSHTVHEGTYRVELNADADCPIHGEHTADVRPWDDIRATGILWLINAAVFHPRGFAFALVRHDGHLIGWRLLGDGTEPWRFGDECDEPFAAVEALLAGHRASGAGQAGGEVGERG